LRYWIYEHGTGQKAIKGSVARIEYSVSLLNGETIYRSSDDGPKEFTIGRGGVESGLEEGILFLKEGDRAKFILPSHLAYGLLGDQDKIPARSVLVYDLKLLKIK
jgi:FKBP-type peptidyl-prolyl cis-trans isomerase